MRIIYECPLLPKLGLSVIFHQCRLCGDYRSYCDNSEGLLLVHTTLSTKIHKNLV